MKHIRHYQTFKKSGRPLHESLNREKLDGALQLWQVGVIGIDEFLELTQDFFNIKDREPVPEGGPRFLLQRDDIYTIELDEYELAAYRAWTGEGGEKIVEMRGAFYDNSFSVEILLSTGARVRLQHEHTSLYTGKYTVNFEIGGEGRALPEDEARALDMEQRFDWYELVLSTLDRVAPESTAMAIEQAIARLGKDES